MSILSIFLSSISLLADGADAAGKAGDAGQGGPPGLGSMLLPLAMIFVLFYFIILRPEKRKSADHRALLESIKKNDRVVTIGGIYGVVMNVQKESDRVTLKIDESNNTKIDVTFNAIARVMAADAESEK